MTKLERAHIYLQALDVRQDRDAKCFDSRVLILVTFAYLVIMLSVPVEGLGMLIWFAVFPILNSAVLGIGFSGIFLRSLMVLPIVLPIAVFNPFYDHRPAFQIDGVVVSLGWITFVSVLLRGLLGMQAILILMESVSFRGMCGGLRRLGVPSFITDQLLFIFRYLTILLTEAISMKRAREARGYGRKNYPVKVWGVMIGQLFMRSIARSERIGRAMAARGFTGTLPDYHSEGRKTEASDWIYLGCCTIVLIVLRVFDLSRLFNLS
ncbi:MAG: cobalt ECF transporter T component CbiQ [Bacteroides sp.]|nr:cobalt ECF transporter T component CbiQ [Bacteroides sp.]